MKSEVIKRKNEVLNFVQNVEDEKVIDFLYGFVLGQDKPQVKTNQMESENELVHNMIDKITDEKIIKNIRFLLEDLFDHLEEKMQPTDQSKSCI